MTDIAVQAMEALHNCRCCLRRPPDKGLKTMYESVGKTEVYWEMLKQCFDIRLNLGNDECGICEVCVNRLRDANDFKNQVQQSQLDLKSLLERALAEKDKKPPIVKVEIVEEDPISAEPLIRQSDDAKKEFKAESDDLVSNLFYQEVIVPAESVWVELETDDDTPPYFCQACQKKFQQQESLTRHMFAVHAKHDFECYNAPTKNINTCNVCCQYFAFETDLITHMQTHMETHKVVPKPYSCEKCEKEFTEATDLKKHELVHTVSCQVCGRRYKSKAHLKAHMLSHAEERPHKCEVCHKQFKQSMNLVFHRRSHMKKRPHEFSCEVSKQKFSQKSDLETHICQDVEEKFYSCQICSNRFARKSSLDAHMRCSHMAQKPDLRSSSRDNNLCRCDICGTRFQHKTDLEVHMKRHIGVKPYSCNVCKKRFTKKRTLNCHKRLHAGG